jgi:dihydrolipoamide dehydrogenase
VASQDTTFDLTVIGSGPGGYVCAIRAAQLGLKTACIEMQAQPGGTCLLVGCIPTKALLHAAEVLETSRHAGAFGVVVAPGTIDVPAMQKYKDKVVGANVKGVEYLFKKNKVTLIRGRGTLLGGGKVQVEAAGAKQVIASKSIVLATGSVIRGLPGVEFDGRRIINSDHALSLPKIPTSMIVLGAGAVGRRVRVDLRVVRNARDGRRAPAAPHPDRGRALGTSSRRRSRSVGSPSHRDEGREGREGEDVARDRVEGRKPSSSGRGPSRRDRAPPLTENMGLERGSEDRPRLRRGGRDDADVAPGIYAIGDIVKTQALAHVASHEGIVAAEHAAGGHPHPIDYDRIPSCTYCDPGGRLDRPDRGGGEEARSRRQGRSIPVLAIAKAKNPRRQRAASSAS